MAEAHLEPESGTGERFAWWPGVVVTAAAFIILQALATDFGYEGDGINSYVPMMYLAEAKAGLFELYRYHWQPLSYELGALVYRVTGTIHTVQLLPSVAIAATIGLLVQAGRGAGIPVALTLAGLIAFPEIIYSGLYFNSSALAVLPAVAGGLLAFRAARPAMALVSGTLLTIAALFRLDFILCAPVFFMLALTGVGGWRAAWLVTAGSVATLVLAVAIGLFDPAATYETYRISAAEIAEKSLTNGGWSRERQLWVLAISFSPVGFLLVGLAVLYQIGALLRRDAVLVRLGFFLALLPALSVVSSILSPKYLLPFAVCSALILIRFWSDIPGWLRRTSTFAIPAAALLLITVSVDPERTAPFLSIRTSEARQVPTHDGVRSHGAYGYQFLRVGRWRPPTDKALLGGIIADMVRAPGTRNVAAIGKQSFFPPGGAAWREAVRILAGGPHEVVPLAEGLLRIDTPEGSLWLMTEAAQIESYGVMPDCIFDLTSEEQDAKMLIRPPNCG